MATQRDIAAQMVAQLRLLDPNMSAEVGTPERKILDTVAQALADSQIDLNALRGALDIDSKFGSTLDNFVSLFGFARKDPAYASGFVEFGRLVPSSSDIRIPTNTRVQAVNEGAIVIYATTLEVTLSEGDTSVVAPIKAVTPGATGNLAANSINAFAGNTMLFGITTVTNPLPISGGQDIESDNALKVRFKNTIFRNLAGTEDQYLALAVATSFASKANIVGPISRYQEYIQVPEVDDATSLDIDGDSVGEPGNGSANEYTSALSTIPYSKYLYSDVPIFLSNGRLGADTVFFRRSVDFEMNTTNSEKNRGDAHRLFLVDRGDDPTSVPTRPNITFSNVYTGIDPTIQAIRPNDVVLFEHSYLSTASRNELDRYVTNCIDVYIDGGNNTLATVILPAPTTANLLVSNPASKFHYNLYRRTGEPFVRPTIGNLLMPLMYQPVIELPDQILVRTTTDLTYTFTKDVNYWAVEDVTVLGGTVRGRSGIEWSMDIPATLTAQPNLFITDPLIDSITITDYTYDRAVLDLQAGLESNKQVTSDVLAHKATTRYFKLDITVMYSPGTSPTEANANIREAVQGYLTSQHFGSTIQLSDLLQVIHTLPSVDNVRWTSDVPGSEDLYRIQETDRFGRPLVNVVTRVRRKGTVSLPEIQEVFLSGSPIAGNFAMSLGYSSDVSDYSIPLAYNVSSSALKTALNNIGAGINTITGTGTIDDPWVITFTATGAKTFELYGTPVPGRFVGAGTPATPVNGYKNLYNATYVINSDFFLRDNELPSLPIAIDESTAAAYPDTQAGMIIRPRAQNTWSR